MFMWEILGYFLYKMPILQQVLVVFERMPILIVPSHFPFVFSPIRYPQANRILRVQLARWKGKKNKWKFEGKKKKR